MHFAAARAQLLIPNWCGTGLLIYGGYGVSHSTLERESVSMSAFSPEEDNSPLVNLLVMNEDTY
jgi:hypothetical protein